jgi:mannitol/fructose-specific phosphotransferase system IIA component (Ntr-type)
MRLIEILSLKNVIVPLNVTSKNEAIARMVELLGANGELLDVPKVLEAVLDREATRSTGIGNAMAIPHGKCAGVDHLVLSAARTAEPINFDAIDGKPVSVIWLLCSPPDKVGPHIQVLARISRLMTVDRFRNALIQAPDAEAMHKLIISQEELLPV